MDNAKEKFARAAILSIPGIGSQRLRHLLALFGSAQKILEDEENKFACRKEIQWIEKLILYKNKLNLSETEDLLSSNDVSLVIPEEENYPPLLRECSDAPPLLFYKGKIEANKDVLAVVGSRRPTAYGKAAASALSRKLAERGFVIASGLARGIDSAAHKGALEAGGITWAFLAGGLDEIYPQENKKLAEEIAEKGALISEYPIGSHCERGQFPARNRLISGSACGVLVVEAAQKSGSLITVDFALEQGREVFAVPGPIFSEMSKGTHQLIRQGAKLVENIDDILVEISSEDQRSYSIAYDIELNDDSVLGQNNNKLIKFQTLFNNEAEKQENRKLLEYLSDVPLHIDRLALNCSMSPHTIALGLLELELEGRIIQLPGQYYVLARK